MSGTTLDSQFALLGGYNGKNSKDQPVGLRRG